MKPAPYARLDKDGRHVLCANISCGTRLAERRDPGESGTLILLSLGWFFDRRRGLWRLSNRAERRRAQGHRLVFRSPSPIKGYIFLNEGEDEISVGNEVILRDAFAHIAVDEFPAMIVCPGRGCGREQILDAVRLKATFPPPRSKTIVRAPC